jgi:hypothetical protein
MRTDRKLGLILSLLALIASTINLIGLFVYPETQPLQSILLAVNGALIGFNAYAIFYKQHN